MKLEINTEYKICKNPKDDERRTSTQIIKSIEGDSVKIKGFRTEFKLIGNRIYRGTEVWVILDSCSNIEKSLGSNNDLDSYWKLVDELINKNK